MNHKANKISTRVLAAALLLVVLFCLCACVSVTGVTVDKRELFLEEGESVVVTATVSPEDADDKTVTWTTSDKSVATVDNGKITAISEGTAIVTVTTKDGDFTATVTVTVTAKDVLKHFDAKAATCTASGNVEYWQSEKTGKYYSDAEGKNEIASVTIEAIGHTPGAAATCDQPQICTVCEQVVKAALGHNYSAWTVTVEPTETSEGSAEKVCANDRNHKETVDLPCLDESNGYVYTVTAKPVGDVDGVGTYSYAHDGQIFSFNVTISATGHTWDNGKITVTPTCEEKGLKVYTCTKCGATKEKTLAAYDHTYRLKEVVSEPTCTEAGVQLHRCTDCGEEKRVTTRALGHDGEVYWVVAAEPTETTPGELVKTCGRDGCVVETAELDVLDRENSGFYGYDRISTDDDDAYEQVRFTYYGTDKKGNYILDVNGDRFEFVLDVEPFYVVTFLYRTRWNVDVPIHYECEVNVGDKVEVPSEIITEGEVFDTDDGHYFFSHWEYDGSSKVFNPETDAITENTYVDAIYTRKVKVTVKDHDGDMLATEYYEIGEAVAMPDAPTCSGYRFNGWTVDSNAIAVDQSENYIVQVTASKDVTITADCVKQYNVTFKYFDANGVAQVVGPTLYDVNTPASELEIPELPETIKGYRYADPAKPWKVALGKVTKDVVYEVNCIKTFNVTFKLDENTIYGDVQVVDIGKGAVKPENPTMEGYRFDGWKMDFSNVQKDLTIMAKWVKQYTVTFKLDENTTYGDVQTVDFKTSAVKPADPEREGYRFDGWDTDFSDVQKDLVVTAKWVEIVTYTFVDGKDNNYFADFTVDKGDINGATTEFGKIVNPGRKEATDIYYGFAGWNTDQNATGALQDVVGTADVSKTFYAVYVKQVKVTFVDHDGVALEGVEPQFVAIYFGANPPETYECSDPHHTFMNNWVTVEDDADYTAVMGNVKNITVKPVCEASYAVKFVDEDGETNVLEGRESLPVVEGNKVAETDIPVVTKEADRELGAYKFVGWTIKGTETVLTSKEVADKAIDADVTFVATFELMPTFKVVGVSGAKGDEVHVAIQLLNMPKLSSVAFEMKYDSNVLTLTSDSTVRGHAHYNSDFVLDVADKSGFISMKPSGEYGNPNYSSVVVTTGDYQFPETMVYFTFKIADNATGVTDITLSLDDMNIFHKDTGTTVYLECGVINGTVTITN